MYCLFLYLVFPCQIIEDGHDLISTVLASENDFIVKDPS